MSDTSLRVRSVSEVVDAAFALYRRHSGQYIIVAALAQVPILILQIVLQGSAAPGSLPSLSSFLPIMVVSMATQSVMTGVVTLVGSQVYLGGEPDAAAAVAKVLPRLVRLIVASGMRGVLYVAGVLCFLVGALYVAARYFALEAAIVLEDQTASAAFTRSGVLSAGNKWHVLKTLLLVFIIYFVMLGAAAVAAAFAGNQIVSLIVSSTVAILAGPVVALVTMVLYYDARIRNEGFDLEHMAAALGSPAPVAGN